MQRWPHLSCRHEVYLLNDERYAIATRQMADWWAAEKPSTRTPYEVSEMVLKVPSRNYIQLLVGER